MKPRLLICIDWFDPAFKAGGPIRSISNLIPFVLDVYDVFVLTGDRDLNDAQPFADIDVDSWVNHRLGCKVRYVPKNKQSRRNIFKIIQELKPDRIYVNSQYSVPFSLYPLWFNKVDPNPRKLIWAPRGMLQAGAMSQSRLKKLIYNYFIKTLFWSSNIKVQATDEKEKEDVLRNIRAEAKEIAIVGNVPVRPVDQIERIEKGNIVKLIFVSRLSRKKNFHLVLSALSAVKAPCELDVYGEFEDDNYRKQCNEILERNQLESKVHFHGVLSPDLVRSRLEKSHVLILPTKGENFGHAIYEALAAGRPVIIGKNTPWYDIQNLGAGFVVHPGNLSDIVTAIESVATMNDTEYTDMSRRALDRAHEYYNSTDWQKAYEELLA